MLLLSRRLSERFACCSFGFESLGCAYKGRILLFFKIFLLHEQPHESHFMAGVLWLKHCLEMSIAADVVSIWKLPKSGSSLLSPKWGIVNLGPYYNTGPNLGDPKRDHNFDNPPNILQSLL